MRFSLASLRAVASARLSAEQKLWLSEIRHAEQPWQQRASGAVKQLRTKIRPRQTPVEPTASTIATNFDAHEQLRRNLAQVCANLRNGRVEYVELPRLSPFNPVIVISESEVLQAYDALKALPLVAGWRLEVLGQGGISLSAKRARQSPSSIFSFVCERRLAAPNGRILSSARESVTVEVWKELGADEHRVDGATHLSGTLHRRLTQRRPFVEYFTPRMWRTAVDQNEGAVPFKVPHIYSVTEPVDIVFTWVDGRDPEWRRQRLLAQAEIDVAEINESAVSESRFVSRDELRYSFRSIEYYASWVNHIYLVTDGQLPEWLDVSHPKITVVDHRDIFRDPQVLPVYNSHAIESQLHHIPGLSERYIYMNDDIFFMRPVAPELFFESNGLSKFFPSTAPLDLAPGSPRDLPVLSAAKNGRRYIESEFLRTVTNKFKHTPHAQLRSVLYRMESEHQDLFDAVAASRFRHPDDFSIPSALYHFHAYLIRRAVRGSISYAYMDIARADAAMYLRRLLRRRDLDVLCLNDTNTDVSAVEEIDTLMANFFVNRFPVQSSFEVAPGESVATNEDKTSRWPVGIEDFDQKGNG